MVKEIIFETKLGSLICPLCGAILSKLRNDKMNCNECNDYELKFKGSSYG